jgi:prepilin-type N-terminal cleavage/methylation domain-containing protein
MKPVLNPEPPSSSGRGWLRAEAGFTVLELTVVMVILALLMAVSVPALGALTGADLKAETRRLSSVVRNVYDEAFLRNRPMRVVWNLDKNAYWVEISDTEARIFRTPEAREDFEDYVRESERLKERLAEEKEREQSRQRSMTTMDQMSDSDDQNFLGDLFNNLFGSGKHAAVHPADYEEINGFRAVEEFPVVELPDNVRMVGVLTYAFDDVVEPSEEAPASPEDEVRVSTTFFPSGYVEDTVVYLSDDRQIWSLILDPLTGRLSIEVGMAELPRYEERVVYR